MEQQVPATTGPRGNGPRERTGRVARPKDAATLIVVDREGTSPRVLMGKRHAGHVFMPGKFVFPGGRIELADRHMPVASELPPPVEAALCRRLRGRSAGTGRALALTAIRETYEETGLLIGRKVDDVGRRTGSRPSPWDTFRHRAILPDLSRMSFIGRAITPPGRPKRFDARFFTVDRNAIAAELPDFVGPDSELVEVAWLDLAAARDLDLPRVTRSMLDELERRISLGFGHDLPVPFFSEKHGRFVREDLA